MCSQKNHYAVRTTGCMACRNASASVRAHLRHERRTA
jgi:hypothetical protein